MLNSLNFPNPKLPSFKNVLFHIKLKIEIMHGLNKYINTRIKHPLLVKAKTTDIQIMYITYNNTYSAKWQVYFKVHVDVNICFLMLFWTFLSLIWNLLEIKLILIYCRKYLCIHTWRSYICTSHDFDMFVSFDSENTFRFFLLSARKLKYEYQCNIFTQVSTLMFPKSSFW